MMRRAISVLTTLGLTAGLVATVAGGANAYPPGTALVLTTRPNPVHVNSAVVATAYHVKPGCNVTFAFVGRTTTVGSYAGAARVTFRTPSTPGPRLMFATTTGCGYTERAYTRVIVTGPVVHAPPVVHRWHPFKILIAGFPARHVAYIRLSMGRIRIVQHPTTNWAGGAGGYFRLSRIGTYLVVAYSGHAYATAVIRVVR
jgi:hypothetical protein